MHENRHSFCIIQGEPSLFPGALRLLPDEP